MSVLSGTLTIYSDVSIFYLEKSEITLSVKLINMGSAIFVDVSQFENLHVK